jgi:hypothetical protein
MKDKKPIDWKRISWHKFASAIEILHLSEKFRQDKESHLELIRYSLIEYNYGAYIRGIAKQSGSLSKINASINSIEIGGLKKHLTDRNRQIAKLPKASTLNNFASPWSRLFGLCLLRLVW